MKTLRSWVIGIVGVSLIVACTACKGGGGGGRSGGRAPGVTAGSSGERGRVTFQVGGARPGFVRLYVGTRPRSYDMMFDLNDVRSMDAVSSAIEPRLARRLEQPGVYFVALTFVDGRGRESSFSNEIRVDTRPPGLASAGSARHASARAPRERAGGRA